LNCIGKLKNISLIITRNLLKGFDGAFYAATKQKQPKFRTLKVIELKRIVSSLLLFLVISSQIGTYMVYAVQQAINKENIAQTMAHQLPEDQLVKIKNTKAIDWEEAGKEFTLNGIFYDVVKTEKINGETWFYCINDTMQTQLYNNYTVSLNTKTEGLPLNKESKQVLKFSLSYFILDPSTEQQKWAALNNTYYLNFGQDIPSIALPIHAPPPKLV